MSDYEATNETSARPDGHETGASVDKIRDILFGSQIKNYEARFARLEENLVREGFFKSETEALAARLRAEREERTSHGQALERDMKAGHEELGRRINNLDASTAEAHSALRKDLMSESHKLIDEINQRYERLRSMLENRVGELRNLKTDRAVLAALLADMATKIGEDSQPEQTEHGQTY
jgi:hypothetical protein